jgi:putative effector of murein hydrolase
LVGAVVIAFRDLDNRRIPMRRSSLAIVLILTLFAAVVVAQEAKLLVTRQDTVASILSKQISASVTLKLDSGTEISGKVKMVGDHVVHITEVTGKEFYDAVVNLEDVEAVVLRAR